MKYRSIIDLPLIIGICVFWSLATASASAMEIIPTVFIHANLIPMVTEAVLYDHTVVVNEQRISAVGPAS